MLQQALIFDFSLGELSPKLRGRFDLPIYQHGASLIQNAIPFPQGGFTLRPGSEYLGSTKSGAAARLIPFVLSPTLAYTLEMGATYMRIWKDGVILVNGGNPLEFVTPFTLAELPEIQCTQDDVRIIFTHQNRPVQYLELTAVDSFTYGAVTFSGNAGEIPFQSATNYPRACQFHEGRLWFASTGTKPGGIWASKPYKHNDFTFYEEVTSTVKILKDPATWADRLVPEYEDSTTTRDVFTSASAIEIEVDDTILWLSSGRDLIVGSVRGERVIPAGSVPPLVQCRRNTAIGTAAIQPFMLAGAVMMVEADKTAIREYQYIEQENAYHAPALSFTADHILQAGVTDIDYQNNPLPIVWALRADGVLIGCLYEKAQGISAWFRVVTDGIIESIAVVPNGNTDTLYMIVNRDNIRYIEQLHDIGSSIHLDASVTKTVAAGAITGLTWLSGTVALVYNHTMYSATVTAGSITVPTGIPDGASVLVGLPYQMKVSSMPLPAQSRMGTAHMRPKNPTQVYARVLDCHPFQSGTIVAQLETAQITGPYTGDVKVPIRAQWDTEGVIHIIQDTAQDTTILALQIELDAGG